MVSLRHPRNTSPSLAWFFYETWPSGWPPSWLDADLSGTFYITKPQGESLKSFVDKFVVSMLLINNLIQYVALNTFAKGFLVSHSINNALVKNCFEMYHETRYLISCCIILEETRRTQTESTPELTCVRKKKCPSERFRGKSHVNFYKPKRSCNNENYR